MKKYLTVLTLCSLMFSNPLLAQDESISSVVQGMGATELTIFIIIGVILGVILLLLVLLLYMLSFISEVFRKENPQLAEQPGWWESFKKRFVTGDVKEELSQDKLMDDHSYDGIQELDNFMPPWLQYVFSGTIVLAIVYFGYYTVLGYGKTGVEEYEEEIRIAAIEAEARGASALASVDETNVEVDYSDVALSSGKTIFDTNCAACHASDGGGGVGPNLVDQYWIHGGDVKDLFKVIKYGVIEKGMVPWEDQLNPQQIQAVSSYILSLQGTTPAAPKAPQGELYESKENSDLPDESISPAVDEGVSSDTTVLSD
ncbi:c-type cytochrome [Algoriphagus sp. AGSA1]|uniref:cbb3-type cytochrome c oxidase N-terminal domain-containing protein n=1 Tax=Algoriphagus sp. AGSA1 TaxID=2907213 RepID=UPI001F1902EA|nr:cbb3-type cytochrome c oxidase N-terminal domain-containing protein [Algoriphagus sp. AGSA1]MCE7054838.1 c-type cytochrome [Algoriphagus sp. AGSA1]